MTNGILEYLDRTVCLRPLLASLLFASLLSERVRLSRVPFSPSHLSLFIRSGMTCYDSRIIDLAFSSSLSSGLSYHFRARTRLFRSFVPTCLILSASLFPLVQCALDAHESAAGNVSTSEAATEEDTRVRASENRRWESWEREYN